MEGGGTRAEDERNPFIAILRKAIAAGRTDTRAGKPAGRQAERWDNPFRATWRRFLAFIAFLWKVLSEWGGILSPCRFSLVLVVLAAAIVFATDQGSEFAATAGDSTAKIFWFLVIPPVCGFQTWLWARVALNGTISADRKERIPGTQAVRNVATPQAAGADVNALSAREQWMVDYTPRLLGVAVPLITGLALFRQLVRLNPTLAAIAAERLVFARYLIGTIACFVTACILYRFFCEVRHQGQAGTSAYQPSSWFGRCAARPAAWVAANFTAPHRMRGHSYTSYQSLPKAVHWSWRLSVLAFVVTVAFSLWKPWWIGKASGALPILLLAMMLIVPIGTRLILASRANGFPVVTSLLVWAVVVSFLPLADNHAVRVVDPAPAGAQQRAERPDLTQRADAWAGQVSALHPESQRNIPLIIVATAGGGSRAAYWTATVLGRLADEMPGFAQHVFAISGVSGGSLGAVTFLSLLAAEKSPEMGTEPGPEPEHKNGFAVCGQEILGRDFLAPLAGSFFFPDLVQRFIPLGLADRAQAIEQAWEYHWRQAIAQPPCSGRFQFRKEGVDGWFAAPFLTLWPQDGDGAWRPALFLNGTHQETGKRVITSPVRIEPSTFLDAIDFYELVDDDVRLSTAANNSARFTYVQPAGTLMAHPTNGHLRNNGHILDGGYFENFGAITAGQVLRRVVEHLKKKDDATAFRPFVIQISSDPDIEGDAALPLCAASHPPLARADEPGDERLKPKLPAASNAVNEVSAPIRGLLNTRGARGQLAAKELCHQIAGITQQPGAVAGSDPRFFHFRLCAREDYPKPPLGWALSKRTRENLATHFDACGNKQQFCRLVAALAPYLPATEGRNTALGTCGTRRLTPSD
ncbi:MAG: hypothetical protein P9C36_05480 [Defluviicoccus sp.]|nr:hypothetical protein [Defluviicoccus sp.]MDG4592062.1 hypothetical protein [Defluviicoccus sp.]